MPDILPLGIISFIVGFTAAKKYFKEKNIFKCIIGGFLITLICEIIHMALIIYI